MITAEHLECPTEESDEYCFHRLGELRCQASSSSSLDAHDRQGQDLALAVASKHGWTIFTHGASMAFSTHRNCAFLRESTGTLDRGSEQSFSKPFSK